MGNFSGHGPLSRLNNLFSSVIEYTDHAANDPQNERSPEYEENSSMQDNKKSSRFSSAGGTITALVSLIALVFSGYSFYETVLKQPTLKLYAPPLIHMYRKNYKDILAIPITLSNDGARRGTVLSIDLEVSNLATGETKKFRNIYFGNDPKNTSRIFTPLTISGRSSISEIVLFEAEKTGAFFETTGGVQLDLRLKMKMNTDQAEYWRKPEEKPGLNFDVNTGFIRSFNDMERGQPTILRIKNQ